MNNRRNFIKKSVTGTTGLMFGGMGINAEPFTTSILPNKYLKNLSGTGSERYTLLTTAPPYGSQNVGDKLIEQRTKELVSSEKGSVDFLTVFREEPLEPYLDQINSSRAILLPGFPVRDTPMYPGVYQLVKDLSQIRVPMIPIGGNWNVYPGDEQSRREVRYSEKTLEFLMYISGQVNQVSCREYYTCDILAKHGIDNTLMTGDPAWFLLSNIGKPMHRPLRINRIVFSPPLSPYYLEQAKSLMEMLTRMFPDAERVCAFHLFDADSHEGTTKKSERSAALTPDVTAKNRAIRKYASTLGYQIKQMAGNLDNLEFYQSCDLHVGYECHAHLNFFSRRIPSVLIAEDARGIGFNYTLGVGGFTGFMRAQPEPPASQRKTITSGYCTSIEELIIAPPKMTLHLEIEEFLRHEVESRFRRYVGLSAFLDDVYYNRMKPFIQSLP